MEIRHFNGRDDVRDLIRAHGLAWREAYTGLLPEDLLQEQTVDPTEEDVQQWFEELRDNRDGVLVAVDTDGTVRGFADFRWGETGTKDFIVEDEAGLKAIYVEPAYWGQGIGTALIERGVQLLPNSVETLRLEMLSGNEVGHQFYEALEFKRAGAGEYEMRGHTYATDRYMLSL